MLASRSVVAVPMTAMPSSFNRAISSARGRPKVKLNAAGLASSTASNCPGNGSFGTPGTEGGARPSSACISCSSFIIDATWARLALRAQPPTKRLMPNG